MAAAALQLSSTAAAGRRARLAASRRPRLAVRAALPMDGRSEGAYKGLGLYSLKKRIEDAVNRVEATASAALEFEEANKIKQEEMLRKHNLWDDPAKSIESLSALANAVKVVDRLKDLRYKAEEAKLISQLAGMDIINDELIKQAYASSLDASEFLDRYEISKLLTGRYEKEGALVIVTAGSEGVASELWADKLFCMYASWAKKHGCKGGLVERCPLNSGGIRSAAIEIDSEYMFGYLVGEKGTHRMVCSSLHDSRAYEALSAEVDIVPIFLDKSVELHIDDNDLEIFPSDEHKHPDGRNAAAVQIRHIPTGVTVQSSGERSRFANKLKAQNRLKAKLLVLMEEVGVSDVKLIQKHAVKDECKHEIRRYMFRPQKLVHDLDTGIQLHDLNLVLDGNIELFIRGHISLRHGRYSDNIE